VPVGHPNNLVQRGRVYYFRRAVPRDLRGRVGRRELKTSLKTTELAIAKLRCRKFSNRFEQLMETVKAMPPLGKDKIEHLIRAFFSDLLSKANEHAYLIPQDDMVDRKAEGKALEGDQDRLHDQIASQGYDGATRAEAKELLAPFGAGTSNEDFDTICNGILRAKLEQTRILAAMLRGAYQNTVPIDPLFEGIKSPGLPPLPGEEASKSALSVSMAVKKFCVLKSKFDWTNKTHIEVRRVLDWFIDFVGQERKTSTITTDDLKEFRDALLSLPASFSQSKKYKGMNFREAAKAGTEGKTLSAASAVKYLGGVKGFFAWCEDEGYVPINPAQKIKMPVKGNPNEERHPFSTDQLKSIFHSPVYTGCKSSSRRSIPGELVIRDGAFWVPLIAMLSGMRMSEIIQMRVADIKEHDGVTFFNVNDDAPDQSLKTSSARRVIPVHGDLVHVGFLDHVTEVRDKHPDHRLFEDIKPGKNGSFSHNFSKTFGRYLKAIEAKTEKTAFHSFRHCFKDAIRIAEIDETRQDALMGHASQGIGAQYGSKYTASMLKNDMDRVVAPIDLSHLFPE
jgi:integrase